MNSNFCNNNSQTYPMPDKNSFSQNDENSINKPLYPLKKDFSKNFNYTNTKYFHFIYFRQF